ncbi:MAG: NADP-dependent isocitrate dehydrogenase, partial [Bacteroidia bacterium]|nr:NADP-dependent isocitrate dehydrogenase [Bacteroidia bacterium]
MQIIKQGDRLLVPDHPLIPFIEGDGIGKEITPFVQQIVNAAVEKTYGGKRKITWKEVLAGEKAYNKVGSWLPAETIEMFRDNLVGIKGPLTTPVGEGIRSLNVALRQELDLYVCLRPVRWFRGVATPLLHPEKVHVTIFRENTEDIYAGIEWAAGTPEVKKVLTFLKEEMGVAKIRFPETTSLGVKLVSVEGTERLVRAAIGYALEHKLPSVTLVHKGNIMKFTEGGFKKWGYALAEREFPDQTFTEHRFNSIKAEKGLDAAVAAYNQALSSGRIFIKDVIADAFLQNTLLKPEEYAVVATLNLNGDYISDQ